ncbi:MAG: type II secretion system GspH family protein [Ruminococcus sp.]|nr:type II secretion system GspH family protein [Ruminococcus sp.]
MNNIRGKLLKGFTVVELIVVIAIIGILFSIGSLAVTAIIRDSNMTAANDSAHEALTYVQNWLVDLEIKNIDIEALFVDPTASAHSGKKYFQLVSSNCGSSYETTTGTYAGIKVCHIGGDPYDNGSLSKSTSGDQDKIYERLKVLSDNIASTYDGRWRVIVNATDYTVLLAYWEDANSLSTQILGTTNYMFPAKETGVTSDEQRTQTAASGRFLGQYPLAT